MVKRVLPGWLGLDTQAFLASGADVDGVRLAALDTVHDGLAGHAVGEGGFEHGEPAVGGVVAEQVADLVGEPDPPGRAPGVSCSPAMNPSPSQRCRVEGARPSSLAASVTVSSSASCGSSVGVAGDFVVVAQRLDPTGGERQAAGGVATLPVEDVCDRRVGVVGGEAAHEVDGVLVGAQPVGWFARDRHP